MRLLHIFFFNSRPFCCKNMNYSNLSETYVRIHIEIMNYGGRLKTKLYDKRAAVTFLIVNFPFISSSIQTSPAYEVYVIRYSSDWYSDFLDQAQLLTQTVFKQSYVALV